MEQELQSIEQQVKGKRNYDSPPLHLWNPPLSGDIPIRISTEGNWYHEEALIQRDSLVRLFASILRREEDGEYYLVTPGEKWRIVVDLHPLIVTDIDQQERAREQDAPVLVATLNTGKQVNVGEQYPLSLEHSVGDVALVSLDHGLTALFSRPAWYRLVELASASGGRVLVSSGGSEFDLGPAA